MSELVAGLVGGFFGGVLGVLGTLVTSYYGPKKLEEWRERRIEERENGPRKQLLRTMLEDPKFEMRSLAQLSRVSGTTEEHCRRLLIEIGARGVTMAGEREAWALIERFPLNREQ
jgi:hypothetical protein